MANALYGTWKGYMLTGTASVSVNAGTTQAGMYAALLSTAYVYVSSHELFTDVSSAYSGALSTAHYLISPTVSSATFDSSDVTFTAVAAGSTITAVLLVRLNANASNNAIPVAYIDTATGLPLTPNGGNVVLTWDSAGIFTLSEVAAKENVEHVGNIGPAKLYSFNYKGDSRERVGMMAHEVKEWAPETVKVIDGSHHVNYHAAYAKAQGLTEVS